MNEVVYMNKLYDQYGSLLTEKQKEYFEYYYFDNLSLMEISENMNVSRTAVHKTIKDIEAKLIHFEENLRIVEKLDKILDIVKDTKYLEEIKRII